MLDEDGDLLRSVFPTFRLDAGGDLLRFVFFTNGLYEGDLRLRRDGDRFLFEIERARLRACRLDGDLSLRRWNLGGSLDLERDFSLFCLADEERARLSFNMRARLGDGVLVGGFCLERLRLFLSSNGRGRETDRNNGFTGGGCLAPWKGLGGATFLGSGGGPFFCVKILLLSLARMAHFAWPRGPAGLVRWNAIATTPSVIVEITLSSI